MSNGAERPTTYKTIARSLVPNSLLKERGIYLRLGPRAGAAYVRLRFLDALGFRSSTHMVPQNARSFVFVCFGNIMRSPMAEALMKQEISHRVAGEGIRIASAGLHATPGKDAHPWALTAAADFGVSLNRHRAQLVTAEMVQETDAIFAMDFQNKAELLALYPDSKHKVFMLSAYMDGTRRGREITDPYFGDVETTRDCYRTLQTCIRNLVNALFPARK